MSQRGGAAVARKPICAAYSRVQRQVLGDTKKVYCKAYNLILSDDYKNHRAVGFARDGRGSGE